MRGFLHVRPAYDGLEIDLFHQPQHQHP
jgi:hypothetical protein